MYNSFSFKHFPNILVIIIYFLFLKVTLEAEVTNKGALALYGRLGFIRAKRLFRYYLNGVDAFRLKLLFPRPEMQPSFQTFSSKDEHDYHQIPIEGCSSNNPYFY